MTQALEQSWLRLQEQTTHADLPAWLAAFREQQRADFMRHGVPTRKNERWKYADLGMLAQQHFSAVNQAAQVTSDVIAAHRVKNGDAILLVFVDGMFAPEHSDCEQLPQGVVAGSLRAALSQHEQLVRDHFNHEIDAKEYPFAALNTAVFQDGLFLYVPDNVQLPRPLQMLSLASGQTQAMITPLHLLALGEQSEAAVLYDYAGTGAHNYFTNAVTMISAAANARLHLIKSQHEADAALHMENMFVRQQRDSLVTITHVTTGAIFSRDDVIVQLKEAGAECNAGGFYHASRDGQYVDHHLEFNHAAPRTSSGMLYKGIADNKSRAVFNGGLYVEKDAQKINAYQENHNLLLSGLAEVYSKPELEIYADDVKCRHGATTGQLDQDAMFYMRARGIDESTATSILLRGFVEEVLQRITHSALREHAVKQVKFV